MRIVHLTSSRFYGGPERQMIGLARHLPPSCRTFFLSFSEGGRCGEFLKHVRWNGFEGEALRHDTPNLPAAGWELLRRLHRLEADVLLCHGYKANLLGRIAARSLGIPVVAVARGWTGEDWKVRLYEALDRIQLRYMDRIVCVSHSQAKRVKRAGVPPAKIIVIPNAVSLETRDQNDPEGREQLASLVEHPVEWLVVSAGRLSREKGFAVLIEAARRVINQLPGARFIIFGEGVQRPALERQIAQAALSHVVALPGHRSDWSRLLPHADLFVLPSFTEGLPNVILEAHRAAVPVVATAVGGTPEVIRDGVTGRLVPPNDPDALAERIVELLRNESLRRKMGEAGQAEVKAHHCFSTQARRYERLFEDLLAGRSREAA
ncbi:MAG: glycosyltransferase [Gemmataceae bacterium]|nr:glycosyltransferase [Gemmataceae bacterium]